MALTHAVSTNNYGPAHLIVATSVANGTHTTLTTAMADAVSGDTIFLRDSVTENVTLTAGVNITSWNGESLNTPTITGKLTMTTAGTCNISNIHLKTNSDFFLAVTGTLASVVNLYNCYLDCINNTGISYSSSSGSSAISILNCQGDVGTTGITLLSGSSSGRIDIFFSDITNSGASSTASTMSAGNLFFQYSRCFTRLDATGSTAVIKYLNLDTQAVTGTSLTVGSGEIHHCFFTSGSNSCVSIATGASLNNCVLRSSNTNAVGGAGTIEFSGLSFWGSSSLIGTTTQTPTSFRPGRVVWDEVTGTSQTALPNSQYIANNAGLVTITLPATFQVGDIVWIVGKGAGLWRLTANAGDTIHFGSQDTSAGGSLTATNKYDAVQVVGTVANSDWTVTGIAQGNLTVA